MRRRDEPQLRVLTERAARYFNFLNPSRMKRLISIKFERRSTYCFLTHARWRCSFPCIKKNHNKCMRCQGESAFSVHIALLVQGVFQNSEIAFSPSVPLSFFCAQRLRCALRFWHLQPLPCENLISVHARSECVAGAQVFHLRHRFATRRLRACKL